MELPVLRKQSCRYVNRRNKSSASSPSLSLSLQPHHHHHHRRRRRTGRGAHPIEGIYLHPLTASVSLRASAPPLPRRHTHTHSSEQGRGREPLLSASPPVAAAGRPYWITSHHLPSQPGSVLAGGQAALSLCARRIPERRGAVELALTQPANQSRGRRTLGARRRRNHNKSTGVILQLR